MKKDSRTRSDPSPITLSHHLCLSLTPSPSLFLTTLHYPIQAPPLNLYQYHLHKARILSNMQVPLKYDHILWAMGRDDYDGHTCRCPKPEKDAPDTEPIAVPETLEHRPTYPHNLSTPLCKKCNAFHIKWYCPNFTCPYCWTAAPGHWPNKCTKKTFQKRWWEKKVMIKILHIPGTIVTDIMTSLEKKTVT